MKFVFPESINISKWNGEDARNHNGISGTHTAIMYLAEGLASLGHEVYIVGIFNNLIETTYLNVNYINYDNFNHDSCDFIITTYYLKDLNILDKIRSFNKIIILFNNDLCFYDRLFTIDKNKIILAYLNNFGKINIENLQPFLKQYKSILLPNSFNINDIKDVNISEKENSFVFFACMNRGFKLACEVYKKINNFNFYSSTYPNKNLNKNLNNNIANTSKNEIFKYLVKSKYFVYPLINLDNNCIHYDTFAYVVLEALLHGVIVIAPKMKVYEEIYGDAVCYINTDGIIPTEDLLYWKKINYNFGYPLIDKYVEKIQMLENDEELRNSYIQKGLALKDKYSNKIIANNLINLINNKYNNYGTKNILTIFSGRKANVEVLIKYLKKALELKILDEVHFWNNTRNTSDEQYIQSISNLKRTSSNNSRNYIEIFTPIINNTFNFNVTASNNIHIKIVDNSQNTEGDNIEIVLGLVSGFIHPPPPPSSNKRRIALLVRGAQQRSGKQEVSSVPLVSNVVPSILEYKTIVRKNNVEVYSLSENILDNFENNIKVSIQNNFLVVYKNDEVIINLELSELFTINQIYIKTGNNSVGDINYNTVKNKGFYFMDTCEKSWKNYYNYYNNEKYNEDIIIKCDDDIVFIDINKLPNFIKFIRDNDYDLVFANTINNGVSAYYQQNKFDLVPKSLMDLEYPTGGLCGSLWESGKKAETLHNYFIDNYLTFLNYDYNNEIIPIPTRFSINFFGYKGKNWHKISDCYVDDETNLTINYVKERNFNNVLYSDFYVSHLSFFKQVETNINSGDLIDKYHKLYDSIYV
jgi:hypothetical protein